MTTQRPVSDKVRAMSSQTRLITKGWFLYSREERITMIKELIARCEIVLRDLEDPR